jgi:hypothetical protein
MKLCPFRKANPFNPSDGTWLWATASPYNAVGNGTNDDTAEIQACINAAASAGKGVYFPAGTYLIGSSLNLASGVNLRGASRDTTEITMGAKASPTLMLVATNITGMAISDLLISGSAPTGNEYGMTSTGSTYITLERMRFDDLRFGLKVGAGTNCTHWTVDDFLSRNCRMPICLSNLQDSTFRNLDSAAYNDGGASMTDHNLYIEAYVNRVLFEDVLFTDNGGYCMQFWSDGGLTSDITFRRMTLDARGDAKSGGCLAIGWAIEDITFEDLTMYAKTNAPAIYWGGGTRVVMTDVAIPSGGWVYEVAGGDDPSACSMSGTYHVSYSMSTGGTLTGVNVSQMVAN